MPPIGRMILRVLATLALVVGLVWIGQGTGVFPYPASSFMINDMSWTYWGLLLAVVALLILFATRRR